MRALIAPALCIVSGVMVSACGPEEDGRPDDPTTVEVRAVTDKSPVRTWRAVTGLLRDIATANGAASRWGIDTNIGSSTTGPSGYRVVKWSGDRWAATAGRGARIALRGTGDANLDGISDVFVPWVVTTSGYIWRANDTSGNTWTRVANLRFDVSAVDIGSSGPAANMTMWSAGSDGRIYRFLDQVGQWSPVTGAPTNVIRVAGPVRTLPGDTPIELMALTSAGEVWALLPSGAVPWTRLPGGADPGRTDVSWEADLELLGHRDGFLTSMMVTSSAPGDNNRVVTFRPDGFFSPAFVETGPYTVGGVPIPSFPIAVSPDVDRHRAWIVTADNRVYYGE